MDDNIIIPSTNEINIKTRPVSQKNKTKQNKKKHHQAVRVAEKKKEKMLKTKVYC